jgi:ethanolamine utilization protein EutN
MIWGKVVGTIWATVKAGRLSRHKLLIVKPHLWYNPDHEIDHCIAIDLVDAGTGDDVIVCYGAPARSLSDGNRMPVEAAVVAVVDGCEISRASLSTAGLGLSFIGDTEPTTLHWAQ